jgi:hypothetical protein
MYYICKFSDSWSIYEESKGTSRLLQKNEVELLENLCPALFIDNNTILTAIEIMPIAPNKLMKKTASKKTNSKKASETPARTTT